ncbi:MAG: PAS domain S-box protein, partial [Gemmatimonadota bacterium]
MQTDSASAEARPLWRRNSYVPFASAFTRIVEFERRIRAELPSENQPLSELFKDFHALLEELQVASDEIQRQAEELGEAHSLKEQERRRFQELFDLAPDPYLLTDLEGRIREANLAADRLFRSPRRSGTRSLLISLLQPSDRGVFRSELRRLRHNTPPHPEVWPLRLHLPGGGIARVEATVATAVDIAGNPVGLRWLLRDVTRRDEAEEQLRWNEARLQQAQEIAHLGSWVWDLDSDLVTWSPELFRIFGLEPASVVPSFGRYLSRVPAEERESIDGMIRTAIEHREPFHFEHRIMRGDDLRRIEARGQLEFDSDGAPARLIATAHDITDLKRAEDASRALNTELENRVETRTRALADAHRLTEALYEREQKARTRAEFSERSFRMLVETASEGVWILDQELRAQYVNRRGLELLGTTELAGEGSFLELVSPADRAVARRRFARVSSGRQARFNASLTRPDGTLLYVRISASPTSIASGGEQGNVPGVLTLVTDLTDQHRAEAALRKTEERFRVAAESASDLIYEWDPASGGMRWFGDIEQRLGYDEGALASTFAAWAALIHPEDRERVLAAGRDDRGAAERFLQEYRVIRQDGAVLHWMDRRTALRTEDGAPPRWVGAITDVTERREAEAYRERLLRELQVSDARFRALSDSNVIGIILASPTEILEANDAFLHLVGYSREEASAGHLSWDELTPPEFVELDADRLRELIATGVCAPYEKSYQRRDGVRVPVLVGGVVVKRGPLEWICFVLDDSGRREALTALRDSESRFRTVLKHQNIQVSMQDRDLRYTWAYNLPGGVLADDILGRTDADISSEDAARFATALKRRVLEQGVGARSEIVTERDGRTATLDLTVEPFRDAAGNVIGVTSSALDISERKRLETALRDSAADARRLAEDAEMERAKIAAIIESMVEGVLIFSAEGNLDHMNAAALTLLGFDQIPTIDEFTGLIEMWGADGRPVGRDEWIVARALRGERVSDQQFSIRRRDKPVNFIASLNATPVGGPIGDVSYVIATMHDITARRRAELAFRASDERLRLAMRAGRMGSWDQEIATGNVTWSEGTGALFGIDDDAFDGRFETLSGFMVPEDRDRMLTAIRSGTTAQEYEAEFRVTWPDGGIHWIEVRNRIYRDSSGQPTRITGIGIDVTSRKRAESALAESEGRLRQLAATLEDVLYVCNPGADKFLYLSPAYERISGRSIDRTRATYNEWLAGVHPDDRERVAAAFLTRVYQGHYAEEYRIVRPDGSIRWVRDRAVPILSEEEPGRVAGVASDITERKQAETAREMLLGALEDSRKRLEVIIEQMPVGVILAEAPSGKLLLGNRQVDEMWRHAFLASADIAEYRVYRGFHADGRPYEPEEWPIARSVRQGEFVTAEEVEIVRGDGTRGVLSINSAPVRNAEGELVSAVATFYDVTEQRRNAERMRILAHAGQALATSLDLPMVLETVVRLAVRTAGDYCAIDFLRSTGVLERRAQASADGITASHWNAEARSFTFDADGTHPLSVALRTGQPTFDLDVNDETLRRIASGHEHLEALRTLRPRGYVAVPLIIRHQTIGVMSFWTSEPGSAPPDLALVQELGRRTAQAVDNSRLYAEAIAESRRKEEALALLEGVLSTAPVGLAFFDREGRFLRVNAAMATMDGLSEEAHLGKTVREIAPNLAAAFDPLLTHLFKTGESKVDVELTGETPSQPGVRRAWLMSFFPVRPAEAGVLWAGVTMLEITERKRVEAALLESVQTLEAIFEASPLAIMTLDRNGLVRQWNPAAERVYGWSAEEVQGRPLPDLRKPGPGAFALDLDRMLHGPVVLGQEFRRARKDGTLIDLSLSAAPLSDRWGEPESMLIMVEDITERKETRRALQDLNESLERQVSERTAALAARAEELTRSNAELEQYAYVASHDLQEPLRMVANFTQLLAHRYRGRLDSDADEFIGFVVQGVERMHALITGLLAYARVGKAEQNLTAVDLSETCAAALEQLQQAVVDSGAVVTCDTLPTIEGDRQLLAQLFQNLIGNALKFRRGPEVRVHIGVEPFDPSAPLVTINVEDDGLGIAPEHSERIFGMFQRLHGRDEYPGTGIGLTICRKIVERHGGHIWVEQ